MSAASRLDDDSVPNAGRASETTVNEKHNKHDKHDEHDEHDEHESLKYQLLGPSLTKAGQDSVDQSKVSEIIYQASKGSKFFNREEQRDKILTSKIDHLLAHKRRLETTQDMSRALRTADSQLAQLELTRDLSQTIVHVDCDAFYAAVEQLDRPELVDVPFAVGAGVLTTCNYAARRFGCRSGMAGFVAKKLCPQLVLLAPDFAKYTAKAQEVRAVLARYDPRFESASIDEAYLNITAYCAEHDVAPEAAVAQMRREVHEATSITVSAGIAANAKLAKICSNVNKPNGQFVLPADRAAIVSFMRDLPVRKVNGVGRVLERELAALGIRNTGDIYAQRAFLAPLFGDKTAAFLLQCYLGLGRTSVQPAETYGRKSVGTESTFRDESDPAALRERLRATAVELEKDMRRAECKGRTLVLKVKLHTYEVLTRQVVTPKAVYLADDLYAHALPILAKLEQEVPGMKLRLMGLRCTHLVSMKRPDTLAFFGLKPPRRLGKDIDADADTDLGGYASARGGSLDRDGSGDEGWEQCPSELLDDADNNTAEFDGGGDGGSGGEIQSETMIGTKPSDAETSYRRHGKEILPNLAPLPGREKEGAGEKAKEEEEGEWWFCPICSRPQAADERQFNAHIDLCLSRQAIRDTVQQQQQDASIHTAIGCGGGGRSSTPDMNKKAKPGVEKKRGRPPAPLDPRQKRLCF